MSRCIHTGSTLDNANSLNGGSKMTALDKKTESIDMAVEAVAHGKLHAIDRFLKTDFALMDAQSTEDKHHNAGRRRISQSA
jgi:hypothetical protein